MEVQAICCTLVNCNCDSFRPGKLKRRQCEHCKHGWVAHALSKLKVHHMHQSSQVEIVHSNVVFDICSLMLYGTQAIPVRLKILLDRLFSVLKQDEVIQILSALDWTLQDYIRGYVLQDMAGKVLDRWAIMTFEEEIATLQQFLRFGETKSIVELMALQDKEEQAVVVQTAKVNSDIRSFIESSIQRPIVPSPKSDPLIRSNGHHFESLVNSMAFTLPLQMLNSIPTPLLSSRADSSIHEVPMRPETLAQSVDSSPRFISEEVTIERASTKTESEDFSVSDNYSSPSTPCTPSINSDITQISPELKFRSGEKNIGLKKGRVLCSACEKTFYDKGTLKIHFNAVHLKIKHKCTIEGCNMVFSSLRSRNRHSANPNPRLHMPMNRNNRDKDLRGGMSNGEEDVGEREKMDYGASADSTSFSTYINNSDHKLHSTFPSISNSTILFPNLKTVQPVLPFYRSLVSPAELANTPGNLPSLPLISSSSVPVSVSETEANSEPIPKKKSRKSSMPIKIEKDETAEGSCSEDEDPPEMECLMQTQCDEHSVASLTSIIHTSYPEEVESEAKNHHEGFIVAPSLTPFSNTQRDHHCPSNRQRNSQQFEDQTCHEVSCNNSEIKSNSGATLKNSPCKTEDKEICNNDSSNVRVLCEHGERDLQMVSTDETDEFHHQCECCNKSFKTPCSVKLHYSSVHLKEKHMCTIAGCNATFPSRRSRDRHSANLNLHHKLLTKDHHKILGTVFTPLCRDLESDSHTDFLHKEPPSQTSMISKGRNRMGLVYPMSKVVHGVERSIEISVEDEAVLDLSTRGSAHSSSWDSDAGSEEELPLDDSDESCDGLSVSPVASQACLSQQFHTASPITCHVCQKVYSNKGTFRAHFKTVHLRLLHKCKVPGCDTTFSSVRSRNRHSQNPNLHRNLPIITTVNQE